MPPFGLVPQRWNLPLSHLLSSLLVCGMVLISGQGVAQRLSADGAGGRSYRSAERLRQSGRFRQAVEMYSRALSQEPYNPLYYYKKGQCYILLKEYINATRDLEKAVRLKPDFGEALLRLGWLHEQQQHWKRAAAYYQQAIEYRPNNTNPAAIRSRIVQMLIENGEFQTAAPYIAKAREENPNSLELVYYQMRIHNQKGNYAACIGVFKKAYARVESLPATDAAKYYYEGGMAYYQQGEYATARKLFERANYGVYRDRISQTTAPYHLQMAEAYRQVFAFDRAAELVDRALQIRPGYQPAQLFQQQIGSGRIAEAQRKIAQVNAGLRQANSPTQQATYYRQLAEAFLQQGKPAQALVEAQNAQKLLSYDYIASYYEAVARFQLGQRDLAVSIMRKLATYSGLDTQLKFQYNFFLGLCAKRAGQTNLARQSFRQATYGPFKAAAEAELQLLSGNANNASTR